MIDIVDQKIDCERLLQAVADDACGAVVLFIGQTRRWTGEVFTAKLNYIAHEAMAKTLLEELRTVAIERWKVSHVAIVHRIGEVPVGEASVAVAVASPHRDAAFEAAKWLIDTLKKDVPIWKQEFDADGKAVWVHPDEKASI